MTLTTAGFIDAHSHLRSTSLVDHGVVGTCLEEAILRMNAMTAVDVYDDAFVASCQLLLSGITGVQVIFHTFGAAEQYLDVLEQTLKGIEDAGIKAQIVVAITDRDEFLPSKVEGSVALPDFVSAEPRMTPEEFAHLFWEARRRFPRHDLGLGPVGPQWCSDSMMAVIGEIASHGLRVHTHCLESEMQRDWIDESPVTRMHRFDLLGPRTSLAHAVWLTEQELDLVRQTKTALVTCPRSNKELNSGRADLNAWLRHEIDFGIGMDSIGDPILPRSVAKMSLSEEVALKALTVGGERATGISTKQDYVLWSDWESGRVKTVMIDGNEIVRDGRHHRFEELQEAHRRIERAMASDERARISRQRLLDGVMPAYIEALRQ